MKRFPFRPLLLLLGFSSLLSVVACGPHQLQKGPTNESPRSVPARPSPETRVVGGDCDSSLWKHVYNPTRLQVLAACKTVTGVIEESSVDQDGDQHMLLKLDPGQQQVANARNVEKKNGDLVIEAVCANKPTLRKVGAACEGYVNQVQLPAVGDHVRVVGSYVIDTHNGWAEIHPITRIDRLP